MNDVVLQNAAHYICIQDNINRDPNLDEGYWKILKTPLPAILRTYINDSVTVVETYYVCLKVNYIDTTLDSSGVCTVSGVIVEI